MKTLLARAICAAIVAALAAGCGSTPSGTAAAPPVQNYSPPAENYASPAENYSPPGQNEAPVVQNDAPAALPAGQVPRQVVGRWSGGEGDQIGEYLIVTADGRYARGRNQSDPYRAGVIVARGSRFVTYDVDGSQQAGTWEYTNAAGIEVLGVYFGGDYYSYARA